MHGVKSSGLEFYGDGYLPAVPFPSLETLSMNDMPEWEDWFSSIGAEEEARVRFPRLFF